MEQNKNLGRQQDQQNKPERQETDRNENLRRDEERTSRQGLTETRENADAVTSEGTQGLDKQKPMREWDTQKPAEETDGFSKEEQTERKPDNDINSRQGEQQRRGA